MEFSTTTEKRVVPAKDYGAVTIPAKEYTVTKIQGPCLVCQTREVEYVWPSDEEQARKQFKPNRRERILQKLREGGWDDGRLPKVETFEGMMCPQCTAEFRKLREAAQQQRKMVARQEEAKEQDRARRVDENRIARVHHYEWRTVTAKEVDRTPHAAEFRAVFQNSATCQILFRWRAVPGKCRGDSYLMKVGMWVDGRLTAHYHGWNLQDIEVDADIAKYFYTSEDDWPTEDLFSRGFCRWIERAFQPRLLRLKPDLIWKPGSRKELNTQVYRPGTLLIEWGDGSRYVHVLPSLNLPVVAEWAEQKLGLRIEERAFRPVWRSAAEVGTDGE
jgi:hypothetical protein